MTMQELIAAAQAAAETVTAEIEWAEDVNMTAEHNDNAEAEAMVHIQGAVAAAQDIIKAYHAHLLEKAHGISH